MPPQIDMGAIREALERRLQGEMGTPIGGQMTSPEGSLPTGGFNTPTLPAPTAEMPQADIVPKLRALAKQAQVAQGPGFDQDTREISKVLIKKLLEVI